MTILDLQNRKGKVNPLYRDQVKRWKRELSFLIMEPPFWDAELSECGNSLEEAARRGTDVISFPHPDYQDRTLAVLYRGCAVSVKSAVSSRYLLDMLWQYKAMEVFEYLKLRYREGRPLKNGIIFCIQHLRIKRLISSVVEGIHRLGVLDIEKERTFTY